MKLEMVARIFNNIHVITLNKFPTERRSKILIFTKRYYRNDPKFSDRYAWANSADPDQTALGAV